MILEPEPIDAVPQIVEVLARFTGPDLTRTLASVETAIRGVDAESCATFLQESGAAHEVLSAAAKLKQIAGQVNVTIHALGILLCLPHILEPDERVECASLGAGNTGRKFDLETNRRIAEFKFIQWQGGSESIRQNGVFKDFFELAESDTSKRKYLYLLGTHHALKFFNGGRALTSVLSKNEAVQRRFSDRFGEQYVRVFEYYHAHRDQVMIEDVSPWLGKHCIELATAEPAAEP